LAAKAAPEHHKNIGYDEYRGRNPSYTGRQVDAIVTHVDESDGVNEITRQVGLSEFAVSRIKTDTLAAFAKTDEENLRT